MVVSLSRGSHTDMDQGGLGNVAASVKAQAKERQKARTEGEREGGQREYREGARRGSQFIQLHPRVTRRSGTREKDRPTGLLGESYVKKIIRRGSAWNAIYLQPENWGVNE